MSSSQDVALNDFAAIHRAVLETERGRWFLGEFERRIRREHNELIIKLIRELPGFVVEGKAADRA